VTVAHLPHWFTVPEFAAEVGFSEWTIRKEIAEGRLRARRVGRCVRVLDEDGAEWKRGRRDEAS
jgi:excisionase family DNA binding protein